jgi:hypothetical protein
MRKLQNAVVACVAIAAGAGAVGTAAQAQPAGYYVSPGYYAYRYDPPQAYDAYGRHVPDGYYLNGYDYSGAGLGPTLTGVVATPGGLAHMPADQYGPDPNGLAAPDGHVIKCKLTDEWSASYGRWIRRRECW